MHKLEQDLKALRATPRQQFVSELAATATPNRRPRARLRVGIAATSSAALMVAIASVGGVGYAANAVHQAAKTVQRVAEPLGLVIVDSPTSAQDQYTVGGSGEQTVDGSDRNDQMKLGNADYTVDAGAGNDKITAGNGDNKINGGAGNDNIKVGNGNNVINSGTGNDTVRTGNGDNKVSTGDGNDHITVGKGNNTIFAGAGDDVINARNGHRDLVYGGPGRDICIVDRIDRVSGCEVIRRG